MQLRAHLFFWVSLIVIIIYAIQILSILVYSSCSVTQTLPFLGHSKDARTEAGMRQAGRKGGGARGGEGRGGEGRTGYLRGKSVVKQANSTAFRASRWNRNFSRSSSQRRNAYFLSSSLHANIFGMRFWCCALSGIQDTQSLQECE